MDFKLNKANKTDVKCEVTNKCSDILNTNDTVSDDPIEWTVDDLSLIHI